MKSSFKRVCRLEHLINSRTEVSVIPLMSPRFGLEIPMRKKPLFDTLKYKLWVHPIKRKSRLVRVFLVRAGDLCQPFILMIPSYGKKKKKNHIVKHFVKFFSLFLCLPMTMAFVSIRRVIAVPLSESVAEIKEDLECLLYISRSNDFCCCLISRH